MSDRWDEPPGDQKSREFEKLCFFGASTAIYLLFFYLTNLLAKHMRNDLLSAHESLAIAGLHLIIAAIVYSFLFDKKEGSQKNGLSETWMHKISHQHFTHTKKAS